MTMHKASHPRDDVDRLYVSRKEGCRRLTNIEDSVDLSIQCFQVCIEKHEGLITVTRNDNDNTKTKRMTITRKEKLEEKQLYWFFGQLLSNIPHEKTRKTEYLLIAV